MLALPPLPTKGTRSYLYQRSATHKHQGIDLPAPEGTPIYAPAGGVVTHAAAELRPGFSGYGSHVVIDTLQSNGLGPWLLFAHLDHVDVAPGAAVRAGTRIGTVGRTCFTRENPTRLCEDPHLHFEVSPSPYPQASEAARLDPVAWLGPAHPFAAPAGPNHSMRAAVLLGLLGALAWLRGKRGA